MCDVIRAKEKPPHQNSHYVIDGKVFAVWHLFTRFATANIIQTFMWNVVRCCLFYDAFHTMENEHQMDTYSRHKSHKVHRLTFLL